MFGVSSATTIHLKNRTNENFTNLEFILNGKEDRKKVCKKLKAKDIKTLALDLSQIRNTIGTLTMTYTYSDITSTVIITDKLPGLNSGVLTGSKNTLIEILGINEDGSLNLHIDLNYDYFA